MVLIVAFRLLLDVLVQQCAPVHDEQPVRVVLRPGYTLELSRRNQFAHQDIAAPFDTLPPVVGKLHLLLVEGDTVAENRKDGARSQDVRVETFFLERVVLCQARFVHQVHRFLHRVADVLVVRGKREKVVADFLYTFI